MCTIMLQYIFHINIFINIFHKMIKYIFQKYIYLHLFFQFTLYLKIAKKYNYSILILFKIIFYM